MAQEGLIARRPAKDSQFAGIRAGDKDCLSVSVAFGWANEKVYAMFHPEFIGENGRLTKTGKTQCAQFFAYAKHREYMDAYRETIAKSGGIGVGSEEMTLDDSRKEKALKSLFNQAIGLVEGKGTLDADTLKVATEIFKKIGLLKDDDMSVEAPRRYLPARCGECVYKSFVEGHMETGEIENECLRCRALKLAQENGFRYDPRDLLEPESEAKASAQ